MKRRNTKESQVVNLAFNRMNRPLSTDEIKRYAPSVFAEAPSQDVSSNYYFVSTKTVIDQITSQGFTVTAASQSRSTAEGKDFVKHMLRFRRTADLDKQLTAKEDSVTELVLVNSHNGTTAFQIKQSLNHYPVLDESDCSEREYESYQEYAEQAKETEVNQ